MNSDENHTYDRIECPTCTGVGTIKTNKRNESESILELWLKRKTQECQANGGFQPDMCLIGYTAYATLSGAIRSAYPVPPAINITEFDGCKLYVSWHDSDCLIFGHKPLPNRDTVLTGSAFWDVTDEP